MDRTTRNDPVIDQRVQDYESRPEGNRTYTESEFVQMLVESPLGKFIEGTANTVQDIIDGLARMFETGPSLADKINDIPNKPGSFTGRKTTILGGK